MPTSFQRLIALFKSEKKSEVAEFTPQILPLNFRILKNAVLFTRLRQDSTLGIGRKQSASGRTLVIKTAGLRTRHMLVRRAGGYLCPKQKDAPKGDAGCAILAFINLWSILDLLRKTF
ncbi:MAG: hypothetical protein WAM89_03320 [Terriglobales bacterium]